MGVRLNPNDLGEGTRGVDFILYNIMRVLIIFLLGVDFWRKMCYTTKL